MALVEETDPLGLLLVRQLSGRSGSSLLMELLASSERIAFDRTFPYERGHLLYLLHASQRLYRDDRTQLGLLTAQIATRLRNRPPRKGTLPPPTRDELFTADELRYFAGGALWGALCDAVVRTADRAGRERPAYIAEKAQFVNPHYIPGASIRLLHLYRDPRDIWASIQAFDSRRQTRGFGRTRGQSRSEFLRWFADDLQQRDADFSAEAADFDAYTVRYEDIVADPPTVVAGVGAWLGVELRSEGVGSHPSHMTSASPAASVGRWRSELPTTEQELLTRELAALLRRAGYDD